MGVGTDVDIIIASAKAYLSAISRKDEWDKRRLSRETPERKVREDAEIV